MKDRIARGVPTLLASLLVAACTQILGVGDYSVGPASSGSPGHGGSGGGRNLEASVAVDAGKVFEIKPPYLSGDACNECLLAHCSDQLSACDADVNCTAFLAHIRAHPDPPGVLARLVTRVSDASTSTSDAQWAADHGEANPIAAWVAQNICSRQNCVSECKIGRDFSCTGAFDYPASYPSSVELRVRFTEGANIAQGVPNVQFTACSPQDVTCASPLGREQTDAMGFARLHVTLPSLVTPFAEFDGFLLVDAGTDYLPVVLANSWPSLNGAYYSWSQLPAAQVVPFYGLLGATFDPELGLFFVQSRDCRGHLAQDVTVEAWVASAAGFDRCEGTCGVIYQNDSGLPDRTRNALTGQAAIAYVSGVPARNTVLVVRDAATRAVVGVHQVFTRAGYSHVINIYPPTATQLLGLPSEAR